MRRVLQGTALASVLLIGAMAGPGSSTARAQGFGPYPPRYGVYGVAPFGAGYRPVIATYPVPVVVNRGFGYGGYGGYGRAYGRGYSGYAYPGYYHHRHHRFRY